MSFKTTGTSRVLASSAVSSSVAVVNTGAGFTVSGPSITANTPFQTSVITPGAVSTSVAISGLKITSIVVTDSNWNNLDDTAVGPNGGYIKVIGTGFASGATAYLNGSAVTTVFQSSTELRVEIPASTVGTYSLMVFNTDGSGAVFLNLALSAIPSFTTPAGSISSVYELNALSESIIVTGDSPFTYSLYSGNLPPGVVLSSTGVLTGTTQATSTQTTYSFIVQVTDAQNQENLRPFSITINPDTVSWISPVNNQSIEYTKNSAISDIPLSAVSAAGRTVTYSASNLPAGITLTGNTLSGAITVDTPADSTLTATAADTGRLQNINIIWSLPISDPNFMYNTLLLRSSGVNNQTNNVFVDSSANNFSITRAGNATQGAFSPYGGGWSNYFDGTGDYLTLPATSGIFNFGTGDFTIEAWIFPTALSGYKQIAGPTYGTTGGVLYLLDATVTMYTSTTIAQTPANSIVLNTWQHVAAVRSGGTLKIYINGVERSSASLTSNLTTNNGVIGGRTASPTQENYSGYISNLRVVKAAVYTANFDTPTTPLSAIANTSLLTCQSNRFIDNSTNNFAITRTGDTSIQKFNPFGMISPAGTKAAYVPAVYGGSMFFDGSADKLITPASTQLAFGSGNFTLELWFNPLAKATSYPIIVSNGNFGSGKWQLTDRHQSYPTKLCFGMYNANTNPNFLISTTDIVPGIWYHVVITRSGNTFTMYINGKSESTATSAASMDDGSAQTIYVAQDLNQSVTFYAGYISDLRMVPGSVIYTSNFTPPSAPLQAVANTSLLLQGTNAGIYDSTTQRNFETFGDAKISTAVSKWANGSISFDGTGDYLLSPTNPTYSFGTGDFTVEAWVYFNALGADRAIADCWVSGGTGAWQLNYLLSSTKFTWLVNATTVVSSTTTPAINTWYHVAVARAGSTVRIFVNGVLEASATLTTNLTHARPLALGMQYSTVTKPMNGYIDDFRITNGFARYTANFTPPAGPLVLY